MVDSIAFLSAYIMDMIIGDPEFIPHPVRIIGWWIKASEAVLRRFARSHRAEVIAGIVLASTTVSITFITFMFIIRAIYWIINNISFLLGFLILAYLISTTICTKSLRRSSIDVLESLKKGDVEAARKRLSFIVGRDTSNLNEEAIIRAVTETVAENTSDGIIAPMFYLVIGGLPLCMTYKAINTLDSMVGYKNEQYRYLGWASARLDDLMNLIPSRLAGLLLIISAFLKNLLSFLRGSKSSVTRPLNALKVMLRDGRKHTSPNSGFPEAAMAGAIGVRLGGPSTYNGITVAKPYIGDGDMPIRISSGIESINLMTATSFIGFVSAFCLLYLMSR